MKELRGQSNMQNIAEAAGVSVMTVSRALKPDSPVSAATRKRVQKVAEEMGYLPNLLANGILRGKTMTVGMVSSARGSYFPRVIEGVHAELAANGYALLLSCDPEPIEESKPDVKIAHLRRLIERRVDGIVLRPVGDNQASLYREILEPVGIPFVFVEDSTAADHTWTVCSDDYNGGRLAAMAAMEAGHHQIGIFSAPKHLEAPRSRIRGFVDTFRESGQKPGISVMELNHWEFPIGNALEILTGNPRPTLIFSTSDRGACAIYRAAHRLNLNIPEDLSVIGFGDTHMAEGLFPSLTTIRQFPEEIGSRAGKAILHRIKNPETQSLCGIETVRVERIDRDSLRHLLDSR